MTGPQYLARLAAEATSVVNAKDYAAAIRHMWVIREGDTIMDDARRYRQRGMFPDEAVRELFSRLDLLRLDSPTQALPQSVAASGERFVSWLSGVMTGEVQEHGVPTGLRRFDKLTGGLTGGRLYIMAGRPGMGKTTLAAQFARGVARHGDGAGMFSLEMPEPELMARMLCDEAYVETNGTVTYQRVLNPKSLGLTMVEGEKILDAQRRLAELPLMFDFSSSLTVGEIAAKARGMGMALKRKHGTPLKVLVVDYVKFVKATDRYRGQRVYEIGEISASLKQLAKDMNIAVILLAQLSREVEKTEHKIPDLSHLRESGDLEADADLVVFLFRRAYYLQNNPEAMNDPRMQQELLECMNRLLLIVPKNRHGPTGNVEVFCHMGAAAVRDLVETEDYAEALMAR